MRKMMNIGVKSQLIIAHTKTVAKATEMREKMKRTFDNIVQVRRVSFKRASVAAKQK